MDLAYKNAVAMTILPPLSTIFSISALRFLDLMVMAMACLLSFTLSVTIHAGIEQTCRILVQHSDGVQRYVPCRIGWYCIAENFRGRKHSQILQFWSHPQKFSPRNLDVPYPPMIGFSFPRKFPQNGHSY